MKKDKVIPGYNDRCLYCGKIAGYPFCDECGDKWEKEYLKRRKEEGCMKPILESSQVYGGTKWTNPKDHPAEQLRANPDCPRCKGKGWVLVQISEDDVEKDICDCVDCT